MFFFKKFEFYRLVVKPRIEVQICSLSVVFVRIGVCVTHSVEQVKIQMGGVWKGLN